MDQKDSLTVSSRDFYERARLKVALSIASGGLCMFFLGLTSSAGGEAHAAQILAKDSSLSGELRKRILCMHPYMRCRIYMYISYAVCLAQMSYAADFKDAFELQSAGYGFGCFVFLLGFFASLGLAIYYSTLINGYVNLAVAVVLEYVCHLSACYDMHVCIMRLWCSSVNEKRTLKSPFEPEPVYSDASSSLHGSAAFAETAAGGMDTASVATGGKADV